MTNEKYRCLLAVFLLGAVVAQAQGPVKVRLATLAPKDTSFHKSLLTMGEKWRETSGGKVTLTIYTDGTMGSEADMVRRMRIGQLQAAMLTVPGLSRIEDSVRALQLMPMMFRSLEEYDHVLETLRPSLEKKFEEKGFVVLFWCDAGWVRFFSRSPAVTPADYRKLKIFVGAGDPATQDLMKASGFQAVPLEFTDILTGLQTGLIDAVPTIPVYALTGQFSSPAPNMLAIDWVPLVGAAVISKKTWDALPGDTREAFRAAAVDAGARIRERGRAEAVEAVDAMARRGLNVQTMTPEHIEQWRTFAEELHPKIRGAIVPADMFDEVSRILKAYREKSSK